MEIVARLVGFGHALRDEGLPVGSDDVVMFCSGVAELTPSDLTDIYWSGRATLVHRREHLPVFDEVFRRYFIGLPAPRSPESEPHEPVTPRLSGTLNVPDSEPGTHAGDDRPMVLGLQASGVEIQRDKRFAECTPDELAMLRRIMTRIGLEPPRRRTRRRKPDPSGSRLDIRRMAREAMRISHTAPDLRHLSRSLKPRPLVLICDVSGSMADYSRNLLQFAYSMRRAARKVEVFCFGTRLTRITPTLDRRSPDDALKLAAGRVLDWDGGTQIGKSLDTFVHKWGRKGLSRGATVVICSDGLDRGDPAVLADAMERLSRLCHRIIWMNPLVGDDIDVPPSTLAMLVASPFIDTLESGHDLASLESFAKKLPHLG